MNPCEAPVTPRTEAAVAPEKASGSSASYLPALCMVTVLFFAWGFLTVLNDILVPHFKGLFALGYARVMLVQFTFFAGYVVMALPAGRIVAWLGYRDTMCLGLSVMALGALAFLPAASWVSYPVFLLALFILSSGMTLLQVACNPYVTVLGPPQSASSRLNLAQAFNSLGAAVAPFVGGMLLLAPDKPGAKSELASRAAEAGALREPYLVFAGVLLVLALLVRRFRWPSIEVGERASGRTVLIDGKEVRSAWQVRHLRLGMLGILLYCGAEVSIGSFLVNFFARPEIGGLSESSGAIHASYYWMGAMIGRFAGFALLNRIQPGKLLAVFGAAASVLVWVCVLSSGPVAMWAIIAVGLFNSIMFPTIFSLAIDGLGPLTSQGSGILFLGVIGPAVLPLLQGALADRIGIQAAFILPALCYLYVVFYGLRGCRHARENIR